MSEENKLSKSSELSLLSEEKLDDTELLEERWNIKKPRISPSPVNALPEFPQVQLHKLVNSPKSSTPQRISTPISPRTPLRPPLDIDENDKHFQRVKSLPYDKATEEVKRIEEWAIRLGVEEAKEVQRGKLLNILGVSTEENGIFDDTVATVEAMYPRIRTNAQATPQTAVPNSQEQANMNRNKPII